MGNSLVKRIAIFLLIVTLMVGFIWMSTFTRAASTPSLGAAASYGVLASTYTNTSASTVNGSVGFTTGPAVAPGGTHANYGSGAPYSMAGIDQSAALAALNTEPCTFSWGAAVDLSTDVAHGAVGVYTPGVYCSAGAMSLTAGLTLSGSGTYIFRAVGALNTSAGSIVTLADGASACDIFWTPTGATTLGAGTTFAGTFIGDAAITTDTTTITTPACTPAPATITVVKSVINDNGRAKTVGDFPLFVDGGSVASSVTNTFAPGTHTVTESADPDYVRSFSGDCNTNGSVTIAPGDNKFCIVTNDDIAAPVIVPPVPPLIELVKIPTPLNLPAGPDLVTYTFSLRNIGTVTATNLTVTDDNCSPLVLNSGDSNANAQLEINETWTYTCTKTLLQTHTNNAIATGWANGVSGIDVASATVIVGAAIIPPLIHVTSIPNPLTLPFGGGAVTYTEKVTNPGTVPLGGIRLTNDKCSSVVYISGDVNGDELLDPSETWVYTCSTTIAATATSTTTASGNANGLTARDLAIVSVVVAGAVPKLPNTGR